MAACPEGKDADAGTMPTASMPANGGRARSNVSLNSVTSRALTATAPSAAAAARGSRRRQLASPHAPTSANSGHFTHQAEARRKTPVSGPQRIVSPTALTV